MTVAIVNPVLYPLHQTKTLYLVRHGQGHHNVAGEADYRAYMMEEYLDASLTSLGWQQCAALKKRLATLDLKIQLVVTSPLMRTMQTAAGVFGGPVVEATESEYTPIMIEGAGNSTVGTISSKGCPSFVANELCREHLGVHPCDRRGDTATYKTMFPGIDFSEVESNEDSLWQADYRESSEEMGARALEFLRWLMRRKEKHIAVVTHSGFLIEMMKPYGRDCSNEVGYAIRQGYANCEMRSLVLVDRSEMADSSIDYKGGILSVESSAN